ncbi:hypothetical protein MUP32_05120, partial [Candidatus Microgenomates bacterium]|nr:hypothetical protein [Candidatus Microgenomates bacterium]
VLLMTDATNHVDNRMMTQVVSSKFPVNILPSLFFMEITSHCLQGTDFDPDFSGVLISPRV